MGEFAVPNSVLEAIRLGICDFEPTTENNKTDYCQTNAMPGTKAKLDVLASRIKQGVPLWHPEDRTNYEEEGES